MIDFCSFAGLLFCGFEAKGSEYFWPLSRHRSPVTPNYVSFDLISRHLQCP